MGRISKEDIRRMNSCEFKEGWPTLNGANQFIRDVHGRNSRLRAYHCQYCGFYHVTDTSKRKPNGHN